MKCKNNLKVLYNQNKMIQKIKINVYQNKLKFNKKLRNLNFN